MRNISFVLIGILAAGLADPGPAAAQARDVIDAGVRDALQQFNQLDVRNRRLSGAASGVLVFPRVTKGGVALASEYGEGALQVNGATLDYYSVASASVGLTAGMATHSEVILFMTPDALRKFLDGRGWSIGADGSVAVVARGVSEDYDSTTMKKPVLVFVFGEKGLMADLSLAGTRIQKIKK